MWKLLNHVRLFATPWTIESMEFSKPEYQSGYPFPSPGDLPNSGIEPRFPALQADSLLAEPQGKPNRQIGLGIWNEAGQRLRVLPRERTGHSKHPFPTTQEKTLLMDITRWSTPKSDWLYSLQPKMEKLYTVSKNKTGNWLWLRSWTPYCQIQT